MSHWNFDDKKIYTVKDLPTILSNYTTKGKTNGIKYYNVPCAFDIETTSFYRVGTHLYTYKDKPQGVSEKCSIMYVWQLGLNGKVIMGRTWSEFKAALSDIERILSLNLKKRLIIYVHNLSFEFQYLSTQFEWKNVFALEAHKVIYAVTTSGIEFRCSYLLSGYSLAKLGDCLTKYKVRKKVGDLDYTLLRHSATLLTDDELGYCINDVLVVMAYIQEYIENAGNITKIPLTSTGVVRNFCRKNTLHYRNGKGKQCFNFRYNDIMKECQITGIEEFRMLLRAFQGGFTHANARYVGQILNDVSSYDFTSSYPSVMIVEKYPMSHGVRIIPKSKEEFNLYIHKYCCVFDIAFTDIIERNVNEHYISISRCRNVKNTVSDNGRLVCADYIETTITNIDYEIIERFYNWGKCKIGVMYCYKAEYLPKSFVESILSLYQDKTTLKGVAGKEYEYMIKKGMLNSCYGMAVTNPLRDEITYTNNTWCVTNRTNAEIEEILYKYNINRSRFLFYPWGVFVTSYARRNLFSGILACGDDYIYSDTDSIKCLNGSKHEDYINAYNIRLHERIKCVMTLRGIDYNLCRPHTVNGVEKKIGVWDYEGTYRKFKTLGAKRYMVQYTSGEYSLTVSGVNKNKAIPYMLSKWGDECMKHFDNNMYFPPVATGKNIHTYINYPIAGVMTDYNGVTAEYSEPRGVHLEPTDYHMNMSVLFIKYLNGLRYGK